MGYHQAGFEVVGVDIEPQPRYPFKFIQADALSLKPEQIVGRFDAVHASPPCQAHTNLALMQAYPNDHQDLVPATRALLKETGLPWVIENVPGAPLVDPVQLCGSSFGLRVQRHRLFESSIRFPSLGCEHEWQERHQPYLRHRSNRSGGGTIPTGVISVYGGQQMASKNPTVLASVAMGIDWMTKEEMNEAIPPAFTRYIGRYLRLAVRGAV